MPTVKKRALVKSEKEVTIGSIMVIEILEDLAKKWTLEIFFCEFWKGKTCNANLKRVIQGLETFYKTVLCEIVLCGDVLCGDSL